MTPEKSTSEILQDLNGCENHEFMIAEDVKKVVLDLQSRIVILEKMRMEESFEKQARIDLLESRLKEAMMIGTAYCEHAKQTQTITERLVKALKDIQKEVYFYSSTRDHNISKLCQDGVKEWNEHQEWKQQRDYQFCKHVEKEEEDDESPY